MPCSETTAPIARPSQEMLEELEHRNLFLAPLDDAQQWYRYHHLFRELLLARLVGAEPHLAKELHGRSSRWFAENGFLPEAMEHALAAGDHEYVADTIEQWWRRPAGWIDINYSSFLRWIAALPQQVVQPRWMLRLLTTRLMYVRGDTHAALDALDALEAELHSSPEAPAARRSSSRSLRIEPVTPSCRENFGLLLTVAAACCGFYPAENHIGRARAAFARRHGRVACRRRRFRGRRFRGGCPGGPLLCGPDRRRAILVQPGREPAAAGQAAGRAAT